MLTFFTVELKMALTIIGIAMTPVLELRGSVPYGAACGLPAWETIILSIIGNMLLVPLIILCVRSGLNWLKSQKLFRRFAEWSEQRVMKNKGVIEKYKIIGLIILVAIPLPGTGAWTGAMLAGLLNMRIKNALPAIFAGVVIAAVIVGGVSYGFLGAMDFFGLHM